ncbi:MAG: DNA mismatch repair protein MutS [Methylococcales bacterium]|nr:DNA mismatch repair protein MutS [Methylococcales bacterium]
MKQNILQSWDGQWPTIRSTKPLKTGEGVLDQPAFNTIEVDLLFDTINHATTIAGQSVVYRALTQPLDSISDIQAKQAAIQEIQGNSGVRANLEQIVEGSAAKEDVLYSLLFGEFLSAMGTAKDAHQIEGYGYRQYRGGTRLMTNLVDYASASEPPSSDYLKGIFAKITAFSESRIYSLMIGPVYNSEQGFQSKEERKGSFIPATIFKPKIFKPLFLSLIVGLIWLALQFVPDGAFGDSRGSVAMWGIFLVPCLLIYFPVMGSYDRDNCIMPLRDEFKASQELGDALDALGQIDELLAYIKFSESYGSETILPEMIESEEHRIHLTGAKNPILGYKNEKYVGNDFSLTQEKLVFITGPNSGGKTAFCKTITQIQLLSQVGCYVPATSAKLSVADAIFYQAPEISQLDDGEGRFGTELKRTKDIFVSSSSKSLIVLDELSEGTTFEEKMESSSNVLNGFYRKGNNTILITHNHQLVDVFMAKGEGVAKQVEFADDQPSYQLIDGISRISHADRVAKKIGFSKEDIDNYLADQNK